MSRAVRRRRIVAGVVFVIVVAVAAGVSIAAVGRHSAAPKPAPAPIPALPKTFRVVFPEGFTRAQMAARVQAVAKIADHEHHGRVKLAEAPYLAASRNAVVRCFGTQAAVESRGVPLPRHLRLPHEDDLEAARRRPRSRRSAATGARSISRTRARRTSRSTTCSRSPRWSRRKPPIPGDRAKIAAVIYNRLHNRMPLGIDATLRYGLHIPPTQLDHPGRPGEHEPVQHRQGLRDAADPDREPGAPVDRRGRPPGARRLPLLRARPRHQEARVLLERRRVQRVPRLARLRAALVTTRVALLGHPVSHSLSPRMQNAAFAAVGLDWSYTAIDTEDPVAAVRDLVAQGFAGANVTIPHKVAVVAACDEADGDAVNTLLFQDGAGDRDQHRRRDPGRGERVARLPDRCRRRRADALAGASRGHADLQPPREPGRRMRPAAT